MEAIKQTQIKESAMTTFPQRNSQKSLQGSLRFLEPDQKTTGVNDAAKPRSSPHRNVKYLWLIPGRAYVTILNGLI